MHTKSPDPSNTVPEQITGVQKNFEESIQTNNRKTALALFKKCRQRLLDINNWENLSGAFSASFKLTDHRGREVNRVAKTGDYVKIKIPAPAPDDSFDWVVIETIEENIDPDGDREFIAMRFRPAPNPAGIGSDTEHFFSNDATSNFTVQRQDRRVIASILGRNEKPNTETPAIQDKIRNAIVAIGAIVGIADIQWNNLLVGIIGKR